MLKSTCKFDFSDVQKAINAFKAEVRRNSAAVGEQAVKYAVENGTYRDVTGKCRQSNRYEVAEDGSLTVYNDCGYADELEARGHDVVSGAAVFAEEQLKKTFE